MLISLLENWKKITEIQKILCHVLMMENAMENFC